LLELSPRQKKYFGKETIGRLYPEYYLIKVNDFNDVAKDTLDEWIYYLKIDVIPEEFKAKGLAEARKVLRISSLSESEYRAYHRYVDQLIFERDALLDSRTEGKAEGLAEGLAKGTAEGEWSKTVQVVMDSHKAGLQVETIAVITRLSPEQIHDILRATPDTDPLF
jgi:predicted transposase YdaD